MRFIRGNGLHRVESQLVAQAEDLARKGMWEECGDLEKRISTVRSIRLARLRERTRATWTIMALVLALTLVLWAVRIPNPNAEARIEATGISLAFSESTSIQANMLLSANRQGGSGLSRVVLSQEGSDGRASDRELASTTARINSHAELRLTDLRFSSNSAAIFSATKDGCIEVSLLRGQMSATYSGSAPFIVETMSESGQVENTGDMLRLEGNATTQRPRVRFCAVTETTLRLSNLSAASFEADESLTTSGALLGSTISTGELLFSQTATKLPLSELESLNISGISPAATGRLTIDVDTMKFRFSGRASTFAVSGGGVRRDVRPTGLYYLIKNDTLALMIAGIGMFWGVICTVLRIVREG